MDIAQGFQVAIHLQTVLQTSAFSDPPLLAVIQRATTLSTPSCFIADSEVQSRLFW